MNEKRDAKKEGGDGGSEDRLLKAERLRAKVRTRIDGISIHVSMLMIVCMYINVFNVM